MRNTEIAAALSELGILYELDGADRFRVLAYKEGAKAARQSPVSLEQMAKEGRLTEIDGIGKTLAEKITALIETGEIPAAAKLKQKFPASLSPSRVFPGSGSKTARRLFDELGVSDLESLEAAAEKQEIRKIKGLGPKVEENVLSSLAMLGRRAPPAGCCSPRFCRSPRSSRPISRGGRRCRSDRAPDRGCAAGARPARTSTWSRQRPSPRADRRTSLAPPCRLSGRKGGAGGGQCHAPHRRQGRPAGFQARRPSATCSSTSPARWSTTSRSANGR